MCFKSHKQNNDNLKAKHLEMTLTTNGLLRA